MRSWERDESDNKRWYIVIVIILSIVIALLNCNRLLESLKSTTNNTSVENNTSAEKTIIPASRTANAYNSQDWVISFQDAKGNMAVRYGKGTVDADSIDIIYTAFESNNTKKKYRGVIQGSATVKGNKYKAFFRWPQGYGKLEFEKRAQGVYTSPYVNGTFRISEVITEERSMKGYWLTSQWTFSSKKVGRDSYISMDAVGVVNSDTLHLVYKATSEQWAKLTGSTKDGGKTFNCFFVWEKGWGSFTLKRKVPGVFEGAIDRGKKGKEKLLLTQNP